MERDNYIQVKSVPDSVVQCRQCNGPVRALGAYTFDDGNVKIEPLCEDCFWSAVRAQEAAEQQGEQ